MTAVGLGLLAGGLVFFQSTRSSPVAAVPFPAPLHSATAIPPDGALPAARAPAPAALSLPAPSTPAGGTDPAATEPPLPAAPTGDYEINLTEAQVGAQVDRRYAALFPRLRLPPGDLARLRSLLVERQQASIDAANSAVLVGVNPVRDLATIRHVIATVQADADATLRREMGEAIFNACRDFDRTLPERNVVTDLARALAPSREPLRPEQESQLVQILQGAPGPESPADLNHLIFGDLHTRAPISGQTVAAAGQVLSPRQLEFFRELQQRATDADASRQPPEGQAP